MLHELLLALLGYTGDLIVDEREHQKSLGIQFSPDAPISDQCTFKLAPHISFIQPSERYLFQILRFSCSLAFINLNSLPACFLVTMLFRFCLPFCYNRKFCTSVANCD